MKPQLQLIDPYFQSQIAENCDLLIHAGSASIAYAIVDTEKNLLKALAEVYLANTFKDSILYRLDELLGRNEHLRFKFRKTKVCINSSKFTFIPNEIYKDELLGEYAKFIEPTTSNDIQTSNLPSVVAKNVFALDSDLTAEILKRLPKAVFLNQANAFIEGTAKIAQLNLTQQLFLNIDSGSFEAVLMIGKQLQFYNIFEYKSTEEFNYFLLALAKQLEINTEQIALTLSGKINPGEDLYLRIQKYFNNINFAESNELPVRQDSFARIKPHTYFSLLSLALCE